MTLVAVLIGAGGPALGDGARTDQGQVSSTGLNAGQSTEIQVLESSPLPLSPYYVFSLPGTSDTSRYSFPGKKLRPTSPPHNLLLDSNFFDVALGL